MVTASTTDGAGRIGLIAVDDQARGAGVGSLLIRQAHRWMQGRGARQATVVTQLENQPACRLYERLGYHLADVRNYYHFWPLEPVEEKAKPHSAHG
jgi:dTDP-4-amino-4,6-dideoxy-D-galactose acyltransferase